MNCSKNTTLAVGHSVTFFQARRQRLVVLVVVLVLFTRVVVPPGFMPAPITSGSPLSVFTLCAGDRQSAQLVSAWEIHHAPHLLGNEHSASLGFELCEFDALSFSLASFPSIKQPPLITTVDIAGIPLASEAVTRPMSLDHPARAPPKLFV